MVPVFQLAHPQHILIKLTLIIQLIDNADFAIHSVQLVLGNANIKIIFIKLVFYIFKYSKRPLNSNCLSCTYPYPLKFKTINQY